MDTQTLINFALGSLLALVGWLARQLWEAVEHLKRDLHQIEVDLPSRYVRREEFSEALKEIKDLCRQIFDKVDSLEKRKADK
jgi:3-isopropylmalate dehydratase small subunit